MKKLLSVILVLCLAISFAGCSSGSGSSSVVSAKSASEYSSIIMANRDEETNTYLSIIGADENTAPTYTLNTSGIDDSAVSEEVTLIEQIVGFDLTNCESYAYSVSLMNVKAYAIGIFKPKSGQEDAVKKSLEQYVASQKKSFENYLADQYDIASSAVIETAPSGEIVLVMCENALEVASGIEKDLKA